MSAKCVFKFVVVGGGNRRHCRHRQRGQELCTDETDGRTLGGLPYMMHAYRVKKGQKMFRVCREGS